MPFPFLIGAGVLIAGTLAMGAHLSAKEKNEKAQRICQDAKNGYDKKVDEYKNVEDAFNNELNNVAAVKSQVIKETIPKFKEYLDQIKKLEDVYPLIQEHKIKDIDLNSLLNLQTYLEECCDKFINQSKSDIDYNDVLIGFAGILGPGATAGYGLITGLGLGLRSGLTRALSLSLCSPLAMIATPLFLASGIYADSKADENLAEATTYASKIETAYEAICIKINNMNAICENSNIYRELLSHLESTFKQLIDKMANIIHVKRTAYNGKIPHDAKHVFSNEELKIIGANLSIYTTLQTIINQSLFDENLKLNPKITQIMNSVFEQINSYEKANYCLDIETYEKANYCLDIETFEHT